MSLEKNHCNVENVIVCKDFSHGLKGAIKSRQRAVFDFRSKRLKLTVSSKALNRFFYRFFFIFA